MLPLLAPLASWQTCRGLHCRCADAMLRNLYRWLAAGQSALASPPLLGAVRSAMRKVVLQLVAEAGKLGAIVVAADFSSIIIATGKHDLASAVGCASLSIQSEPLGHNTRSA